ncbi:hypothetical protein TVAG_014280 [Trichomonas vaginalis G3]|uniref:Ankyrin repeat domain-containing protein 54 n=1 Tax=Trichomonas vaginalis (strain ATCC PRA-98 / G3) TaxID=412133 RepID=A2DDI2_TRIV3|nr:protein ubiquitination [Trichomonas vaginalis G3]EAY21661.1 hypothetical protein TVAG_014280 [Trichomonas vaginalis G3]KAI5489665.1 protein ubiquitination [Trichomonas vaginalis G3]|eukprot:XP_001582647.1 hypothetical protein [Trichomonas vaginalis G3]
MKRFNDDDYNFENIIRKIKYCKESGYNNKIFCFIINNIDSIPHDKLIDSIVEAGIDFAIQLLVHFKQQNINSNDLIFSLFNKDQSFFDILSYLNDEYIDVKDVIESIKILSTVNNQLAKNNIQSYIISKFKTFQENIKESHNKINELETKIRDLSQNKSTINDELAQLRRENSQLKNNNSSQNDELTRLKRENTTLKDENDKLKKQNISQTDEIKNRKSEKSALNSKIYGLEKSNDSNEWKYKSQNSEIEKLKKENRELKDLTYVITKQAFSINNRDFISIIGEHLPKIKEINGMWLNESKFDYVYSLIKEASDQRDLATILYYFKVIAPTIHTKIVGCVYLKSAWRGDIQLTKDFIECGADKFSVCSEGRTFIHMFSEKGNIDAIKYFLRYDYDINQKTNDGNTPLHLAVINNEYDTCKYLLNLSKINKSIQNKDGETPLSIAERKCYYDIINLLS